MRLSVVLQVMQWKLGRGKFRPLMGRLQSGNSPAHVVACSQRAFQSAKSNAATSVKNAVNALTELVAVVSVQTYEDCKSSV